MADRRTTRAKSITRGCTRKGAQKVEGLDLDSLRASTATTSQEDLSSQDFNVLLETDQPMESQPISTPLPFNTPTLVRIKRKEHPPPDLVSDTDSDDEAEHPVKRTKQDNLLEQLLANQENIMTTLNDIKNKIGKIEKRIERIYDTRKSSMARIKGLEEGKQFLSLKTTPLYPDLATQAPAELTPLTSTRDALERGAEQLASWL